MTDVTHYGERFYDAIDPWAAASAEVIVPRVIQLLDPRSVIDVGCGRGVWLREFKREGVALVRGIDGHHVDKKQLLIDPEEFMAMDLRHPEAVAGSFDLATCLEVGEHLPEAAAPALIEVLVRAAPVVLFSAAVPGQPGTAHINCRWLEYWRDLFARHGYRMVDFVRSHIRDDSRVGWWYRQNIVLFCSSASLRERPALEAARCREDQLATEWVHRSIIGAGHEIEEVPGRVLCGLLARRIWRRLRLRG